MGDDPVDGAAGLESGVDDERLVPVTILLVPVDELTDALTDVPGGLVADQFAGLRDVTMSVFGVAFARVRVFISLS